eukprot:g12973.t1
MNKGGIYSNHGFDTSRDWTTVANVGCIFPSWTTKYYFNTGATSLQPCSESYRCICKTATCTRCPEGYYSNGGQNAICRPCEPGFFCKNETSRSACAAGKYNSLTLQVSEKSCIGCDKGTYQLLPGQGDKKSCISCPKGYYCPEPIYKMKCSIGAYNDLMEQTSETSCRNCSIGTYNSLLGQKECLWCSVYLPLVAADTNTARDYACLANLLQLPTMLEELGKFSIQLRNILQQIESLRKRIEDVYKKDEKIDVDSKDLLSSFRVVSKHLDELTNKIMYNPKNARSDDYSRVNLRHEIIAPNVPDLNLLNVFDSNIHNKNQIFPHQDVNNIESSEDEDDL